MWRKLQDYAIRAGVAAFAVSLMLTGLVTIGAHLSSPVQGQAGVEIGPNAKLLAKIFTQGTVPVITNGTLVAGSTDTMGAVTAGTQGTNIVITFSSAWNVAPFCMVVSPVASTALAWSVSTSAITITGSGNWVAGSTVIRYFCLGTH